jgi:lipopolysaccharide export LptBFGC system permease protein LptF
VKKVAGTQILAIYQTDHPMDASIRTDLVIAFAVVALLLLRFGGGIMGSGSLGGFSWMWLPTLLVVVLGVALFSVVSGKK